MAFGGEGFEGIRDSDEDMRKPMGFLLAAVVGIAGVSALYLSWGGAWRGEPNPCVAAGTCYCEAFRPGWIKQPANTWSCLGFVLAGMLVGWRAVHREGGDDSSPNLMRAIGFFPVFYAALVSLIGPCSMFLHASMTRWGGMIDGISMDLHIVFVISYAVMRLTRSDSPRLFALLYGPAMAILISGKIQGWAAREIVFFLLVIAAVAFEVAVMRTRKDLTRDRAWLWCSMGGMVVAVAVWMLSLDDGPLCVPDSLIQGHAVWHLLCAGAAGMLYLYYESERPAQAGI